MQADPRSLRRQFFLYTIALWLGWLGAGAAVGAYGYCFLLAGASHYVALLLALGCLGGTHRVYQERQLIRERLACVEGDT